MIKLINKLIVLIIILSIVMITGCTQKSDNTSVSSMSNNTASRDVIITQSDGSQVILQKEAERIIVANGDAAEILILLGAEDRIVGGTDSTLNEPSLKSFMPKTAKNLGGWLTPDLETILTLNPDVIITYQDYKPENLDQLLSTNISVIQLNCYDLQTLYSDVRSLGNLTGKQKEAEEYISFLERTIGLVSERIPSIERGKWPDVYFESYYDYTTSGMGSTNQVLLDYSGGNNIAVDNPPDVLKITPEWIISKNPDVVIKVISAYNVQYENYSEFRENIIKRTGMESTSAVQNDEIYTINSQYIYGPRLFAGVMYFAKIFHPELFKDLNPDEVLEEYSKKFMPGLDYSDVIYPHNTS